MLLLTNLTFYKFKQYKNKNANFMYYGKTRIVLSALHIDVPRWYSVNRQNSPE